MSNIHVIPTAKATRNPETISLLEEMLERAKDGDIVEIAAVVFLSNGNQSTMISPLIDTLRKIGALEQIKYDIMDSRSI